MANNVLSQRYALVLIRTCLPESFQFVRGLAAILAEGYENAGGARESQSNSMCSATSELSGLLNQLHRVVEPEPLTHITPIVSVCFFWMDQIQTCW